jgi:hypothetical protein
MLELGGQKTSRMNPRRTSTKLKCYAFAMTRTQEILEEVRRLRAEEQMEVLRGVIELAAPSLSPNEEQGLADAIDEADRGDLVDGASALAKLRGRARDGGAGSADCGGTRGGR